MKINKFSVMLRKLRLEKEISQRNLGKEFNVSNQTVSSWETGTNEPDYDTLIKIAEYFNVTVGFLLGVEDL